MEWNVQLAWLSLWLTVWTISDIKRRAVRLWQTLLVLGVGILWQWTAGQLITWNVAGGMLIGGLAWGFSCLSAERLGKGDALVLLCMGVYLGFAALLAVLMQALLLASAVAVYLLLIRKKTAQSAIPFVPFLAVGFMFFMLIG